MKRLIILLFLYILSGCGLLREARLFKQTEIVSRNTYAIKDSIEYGRYDLAERYIKDLVKLIVVPSKPIEIKPIFNKDGKAVVLLPERLNTQQVVLVGSEEYQKLLSIQEIALQIARENTLLINNNAIVDNAVREQAEALDSVIYERDRYKNQTDLQNKDISKKNITIILLLIIMGGYIYVKSGLKIPFI